MKWNKLKSKSISNNKYVRMKWQAKSSSIPGAILEYELQCIGLYIDNIFIPTYLKNKCIDKKTLIECKAEWSELIYEN